MAGFFTFFDNQVQRPTAREVIGSRLARDIEVNNPGAGNLDGDDSTGGWLVRSARQSMQRIGDGDAQTGNAAVDRALSYLGVRYVWGGNGRTGLDCSGLVQQVYAAMGIRLPRTAAAQARAAAPVAADQARPGDLVIWETAGGRDRVRGGADHIGIYAGNGIVIDASSSNGRVVRRKLWGSYRFGRVGG